MEKIIKDILGEALAEKVKAIANPEVEIRFQKKKEPVKRQQLCGEMRPPYGQGLKPWWIQHLGQCRRSTDVRH